MNEAESIRKRLKEVDKAADRLRAEAMAAERLLRLMIDHELNGECPICKGSVEDWGKVWLRLKKRLDESKRELMDLSDERRRLWRRLEELTFGR